MVVRIRGSGFLSVDTMREALGAPLHPKSALALCCQLVTSGNVLEDLTKVHRSQVPIPRTHYQNANREVACAKQVSFVS